VHWHKTRLYTLHHDSVLVLFNARCACCVLLLAQHAGRSYAPAPLRALPPHHLRTAAPVLACAAERLRFVLPAHHWVHLRRRCASRVPLPLWSISDGLTPPALRGTHVRTITMPFRLPAAPAACCALPTFAGSVAVYGFGWDSFDMATTLPRRIDAAALRADNAVQIHAFAQPLPPRCRMRYRAARMPAAAGAHYAGL